MLRAGRLLRSTSGATRFTPINGYTETAGSRKRDGERRDQGSGRGSHTGIPYDQLWFQKYGARLLWRFGFDHRQRHFRRPLPDRDAVLIDSGQRNAQEIAVPYISAARESDVLRNSQTSLEHSLHGAQRRGIVKRVDAIRRLRQRKQLFHAGVRAVIHGVSDFLVRLFVFSAQRDAVLP